MDKNLLLCPIFRNVSEKDAESMLGCFEMKMKSYEKGETILHIGDEVTNIGVVTKGSVCIETDDFLGNHSLISFVNESGIFAENYACIPGEKLMVNVTANEKANICFLNIERVLTTCSECCHSHSTVIRNLLDICAVKSLSLSRRILHTGPKTIRGRVLSYLSYESIRQGSKSFRTDYNRQQLADYLSVDRSALSAELSKMQKEGIIQYDKNSFTLTED